MDPEGCFLVVCSSGDFHYPDEFEDDHVTIPRTGATAKGV